MKILLVNDWGEYSGAEVIIQEIISGLKEKGHETYFLVFPSVVEFKHVLEDFKPDIVNFHNIILTGILPVLICKKKGIPILQTLHDYWLVCKFRHHYILQTNSICNRFDHTMCMNCLDMLGHFPHPEQLKNIYKDIHLHVPSNYMKEVLIRFGYSEEKIHVIHHGLRPRVGNIKDLNYVFSIVSEMPWKGKEIIFQLQKKYPSLQFVIRGMPLGKLEKSDKRYLSEEEKFKMYRECSLVINPTRWEEPCGLINLEAMLSSKVVLGLKVGSLPEYVPNILSSDYKELEENLIELMSNEKKRRELGYENFQIYREKFTSEKMVEKYIEEVKNIC